MKDSPLKEIFIEANDLFADRNGQYGNTFEKPGSVLQALFPEGITLKTEEDFKRYNLLGMVTGKLMRYAGNFEKGGHKDSIQDAAVYCHMLDYVDRNNND